MKSHSIHRKLANLNYHLKPIKSSIIWKPTNPLEASKAINNLKLKREKDISYVMGEQVISTLKHAIEELNESGILLNVDEAKKSK